LRHLTKKHHKIIIKTLKQKYKKKLFYKKNVFGNCLKFFEINFIMPRARKFREQNNVSFSGFLQNYKNKKIFKNN